MDELANPPAGSLSLPWPLTPFVGRQSELAELGRQLADPACRLLTLVGPGGMGKTRLAIEAARAVASTLDDGVFFVNLQPVHSADRLIQAVAGALRLPLTGQSAPADQLLDYLRSKNLLLLLDNCEHLLAQAVRASEAAGFVAALLGAAPRVTVLATSRESLNLHGEWLYPVSGLACPPEAGADDPDAYSAVQLFTACARRVRPDFSLAHEAGDVIRICRLVEGMPLALELAAAWTKSLRCAVIANEVQRGLAFLAARVHDLPERHRSMRAAFDQSWQRLTEDERSVFERLSVFRGGFQYEAAERAAGASLQVLTALVDKSLLRWAPSGRYQIHELLRQYAEAQLAQSPTEAAHAHDRHCAYFADYLHRWQADIIGGRQPDAVRAIEAELDNVRAAWTWAVQQGRVEALEQAAPALHYFFNMRSRYLEGAEAFTEAVQSLERSQQSPQARCLLAQVSVYAGWYRIRLGQFQDAKSAAEHGQAILARMAASHPALPATDPLALRGMVAHLLGDFDEAERLGQESRQLNEASGDTANLMDSYYVLTSAALTRGHYDDAQRYARQTYACARQTGDRWMMAYVLTDLGHIARALGDYTQARRHYWASYKIHEEFADQGSMAAALNHLGEIAWVQQAYAEAEQFHRRSLAMYEAIGDQGGLARALNGLGNTARAMASFEAARQHFSQALEIAARIQYVPLIVAVIVGIGELLLRAGRTRAGIEVLACAQLHRAISEEAKGRVQHLLAEFAAQVPPQVAALALQRGSSLPLETAVANAQAELAVPLVPAEPGNWAAGGNNLSLAEPLTPREREVLRLIAVGMSNQEIANQLVISIGTVKSYTNHIYGKLQVASRTQAILRARELGLLA